MLLLFYTFAGVGIVADKFMDAITVITSVGKWRAYVDPDTGQQKSTHIKMWNPTVANLTLMALGSSAPEIMLSIIEIVAGEYYSGELGPSTIVGSAAFNMLVILAVCVQAPEVGDVRKIRDFTVFGITAFCSVFAYVWLLFILTKNTEGIVGVTEGTCSFLFFPLMVAVAYLADTGFFGSTTSSDRGSFMTVVGKDTTGDGQADTQFSFSPFEVGECLYPVLDTGGVTSCTCAVRHCVPVPCAAICPCAKFSLRHVCTCTARSRPADKTREELTVLAYHSLLLGDSGKTRADYRKEGVQAIAGKTKGAGDALLLQNEAATAAMAGSQLGFECTQYSCKESLYSLEVAVVRVGDVTRKLKVSYTTKEDMSAPEGKRATEGKDYYKAAGELTFGKGETRKTFEVKMIDDDEVEEDETFLIELSGCTDGRTEILAERREASVTIISDDDPGVLVLAKVPDESGGYLDHYTASGAAGTVAVLVRREVGSSGAVSVDWRTIGGTATAGTDYGLRTLAGKPGVELSGTLEFESSISEKYIDIPVLRNDSAGGDFQVELYNPQGGATVGNAKETSSGGVVNVRVRNDQEAEKLAKDIARLLDEHHGDIRLASNNWGDQFSDAATPDADLGTADLVFFYVNLPWRLIFAFIPPPAMANGWVCFFVALIGIACVTIVVGDLAALLGCSLGMADSITAITFVALGTSLPDTFASKAATLGDDSADAAIGNVTGSNSVNVFLGLGLPWFIAALYWYEAGATDTWKGRIALNNPEIVAQNPEGGFAVPAGSLGFSVTVFCSCAVMCLSTLIFRRKVFGAELGAREEGSIHHTVTSIFFVLLWIFYVGMSVAQTLKWLSVDTLYSVVIAVIVLFVVVMAGLTAQLNGKYETSHSHLGVLFDEGEQESKSTSTATGSATETDTFENAASADSGPAQEDDLEKSADAVLADDM